MLDLVATRTFDSMASGKVWLHSQRRIWTFQILAEWLKIVGVCFCLYMLWLEKLSVCVLLRDETDLITCPSETTHSFPFKLFGIVYPS
jgi:hypothetical protein